MGLAAATARRVSLTFRVTHFTIIAMSPLTTFRRAFAANPHTMPASGGEVATLQGAGIQNPVIQTYLAWRRSLLIVVVAFTTLTAGLATYHSFFDEEEHVDLAEELAEHFSLEDLMVPPEAAAAKEKLLEHVPEGVNPETVREAVEGVAPESTPALAQNEAGEFVEFVELMALYALPAAAVASVLFWTRFQFSFRIMAAAFLFAFLLPMLIALCPWSWWGYEDVVVDPKAEPMTYFSGLAEDLISGAGYLFGLLPTVLSLVPGVQKACVRLKLLLPQSQLPGWFLVTTAPFFSMFLLVIFVAIGQFTASLLFLLGMLLILVAPLCYAFWARDFTSPAVSDAAAARIRGIQKLIGGLTAAGGLLLLIAVQSQEIMGVRLLGWDPDKALLVPMDIVELLLETLSRSMFMTVLGTDLFLIMTASAWRQNKVLQASPEVASYDRALEEFAQLA